ncbi:helix-turn-helix domain-containing protein [candidate division KSB1 bacterium]|nr:helix-turn-helix domain-containing protein [candidate division KSB1 bacterium]
MEKRILGKEEAARLLGISTRKVLDLARAKRIPSFKIGKAVKFDIRDIEMWIVGLKESNKNSVLL